MSASASLVIVSLVCMKIYSDKGRPAASNSEIDSCQFLHFEWKAAVGRGQPRERASDETGTTEGPPSLSGPGRCRARGDGLFGVENKLDAILHEQRAGVIASSICVSISREGRAVKNWGNSGRSNRILIFGSIPLKSRAEGSANKWKSPSVR